jgi:hypothetical protein
MIDITLIFKKKFWLTVLKILALLFVTIMVLVQIPELLYDFGPKEPAVINGPEDLDVQRFKSATFVTLPGSPDFEHAFIYARYGLKYTYFLIEPYGIKLVARTYEPVNDDWKLYEQFVGKLRPFNRQPFSYRIRQLYKDRFQLDIPKDAFFLALYDVPKPSGWQIGAFVFAILLWGIMFYFFFFFDWKKRGPKIKI